jgi:hypothetical protein
MMNDFEGDLDNLLAMRARLERAEIDAGACGTALDYANARKARDNMETARLAFLKTWKAQLDRLM